MNKRDRPRRLAGNVTKIKTGCGNVYITVTRDRDGMAEVFATLGKAGGCATANLEATTRSISTGLRYGVPVAEYIRQLSSIQCPRPIWQDGVQILSCADAIAQTLARENHEDSRSEVIVEVSKEPTEHIELEKPTESKVAPLHTLAATCPECHAQAVVYQEGCSICQTCGWSECS